jgi:prevent-host-death family protein
MRDVQFSEAMAKFSAMVDRACQGDPSIFIQNGRREGVVVSFEEWERLSRIPPFGRLLMTAPLESGDLTERDAGALRDPGLRGPFEGVCRRLMVAGAMDYASV